ncbi:tRNA (adenosine(37)-N6)-dimethylallyltransferase MiaA, partial [Acidithiobacillus ferridurans]|nr:tRNA (adenosine(37)-N6)-dimethylallyltransferase MiaA [Acidithiobacillus ferridurans]
MIPAIFLMGPTASGKTELAVRLADALPIDIISVDSLLAYRHFDIGSAKPSLALRRQYPHALVDIREPDEPYSAGLFREDA